MDKRLDDVENSCSYNSAENDDRKRELTSAKAEIKTFKHKCQTLENNSKSFQEKNVKLESKLVDLEARSTYSFTGFLRAVNTKTVRNLGNSSVQRNCTYMKLVK